MRFLFLFVAFAFFAAYCSARTPWPRSVYERAKTIANQLTKDEKIHLVHGNLKTYLSINEKYTGIVDSIDRLRIPPLHLQDGPQGVGKGYFSTTHGATQWPSALAVTSTWDVKLFEKFGQAMAAEHSLKGSNILLGPMVNLARVPRGGRNYESVGEDPVIASAYAWNIIKGIQEGEHPMMAVIKHGFYNSQEDDRKEVSEVVPLRAARELYFPPFLTAVDAGVGSMMCSYNRINGTYACENPDTMNWFKKSEEEGGAGFDGFIMSDWYATHTVWEAANAGLDQEMPLGLYFSAGLHIANTLGKVSDERLTDMAERIIRAMIATNIFDKYPTGKLDTDARTEANTLLAKQLSAASIVLLKNDNNILPLNPKHFLNRNNGSSILVLGDETTTGASGSGAVLAPYKITPYMGIAERLLNTPGASPRPVQCKTFSNTDFYQAGNEKVDANNVDDCCAKCSARLDCNYFTFQWPNSCWIKFNNTGRRGGLFLTSGECTPPPVAVSYLTGVDIPAAVAAARKASHVVIAVATTQGEGGDRKNLSLLDEQNALIDAVAAVNPNVIVVVRVGGAVLLPWANKVKAIVWQGMGGQEAGRGLASILFGDVNPAARLPLSFPASETDSWLTSPEQYPGVTAPGSKFPEAVYSEELLMGYRWYDKKNLSPAYPFGHGLSYTTFSYTGLTVTGSVTATSSASIRLSITNTGAYAGEEVVQFYISYPESAGEPPKVLRKFQKIFIEKGQTVTVTESLSVKDVQIFDVRPHKFVQVTGDFKLLVGASSRDIRATADFTSA